jgi:hypothetical protein
MKQNLILALSTVLFAVVAWFGFSQLGRFLEKREAYQDKLSVAQASLVLKTERDRFMSQDKLFCTFNGSSVVGSGERINKLVTGDPDECRDALVAAKILSKSGEGDKATYAFDSSTLRWWKMNDGEAAIECGTVSDATVTDVFTQENKLTGGTTTTVRYSVEQKVDPGFAVLDTACPGVIVPVTDTVVYVSDKFSKNDAGEWRLFDDKLPFGHKGKPFSTLSKKQ